MTGRIIGSFIILLFILQACKVGPTYTRPESVLPPSYSLDTDAGASLANLPWWQLFRDSTLVSLISVAVENNRDLGASVAQIRAARAGLQIVRADLYPRINYGADLSTTAQSGGDGLSNSATAGLNVSYIVDLWGRIRRMNEAAFQEYLATEEAYRTLTIIIVSETAKGYMTLLDLDNRLLVARQTAESWQSNLEIVQARFNAGFVSEVDLNQAKIQLAEAETAIRTFTRLRVQTENAISILMGVPPQSIPRGQELTSQVFPPVLPAGIPSELLDRRPDVRAAERLLQAQTERIGIAEALKYPSLTLSADMGAQLVNPAAAFATLGAQVLGPLFNSGAVKAGVEVEKARTEQALNNYESVYLNAIREVQDALIAVETYDEEFVIRRGQMQAAEEAAELSWVRYDGGLTSYLEVLDLQRSLFSSQLKASETLRLQITSTIDLYAALGGGWVAMQDSVLADRITEERDSIR